MRRLPSLTALRFFEETVRHKSFGKAARVLNVTQGAVSRQIKTLEQSLGVTLFERHPQGLELTASARSLLPFVTQAFDLLEQGVDGLSSDGPRVRLRVAAPPTFATYWLSPRLGRLAEQMPNVDVTLLTEPDEQCDCRIRFGTGAQAEGRSELLFVERHVLMGPAWLEHESVETLLERYPLLHVLEGSRRLGMWDDWFDKMAIDPASAGRNIEFSTLTQVIRAARKGVGLSLIDDHMVVEELAEGDLIPLSPVEVVGPYGYWLDIPSRNQDRDIVQAFAQWLQDEVSKLA